MSEGKDINVPSNDLISRQAAIDKELIGNWRNMLKPFISLWLLKTNYEGMGEQDKEEFERDFDEILDLALIGLEYKAQLSQERSPSDTTYRQMAINAIENIDCSDGVGISALKCEGVDDVVMAIKDLPSAQPELPIKQKCTICPHCDNCDVDDDGTISQPEQRWTPCNETIDIPKNEVLCCDRYGNEMIGYLAYTDEQWLCESDAEMMYDPVAWMEKPKPWNGDAKCTNAQ